MGKTGMKRMVKGEGRPIVLWLGEETVQELDNLATKLNMSRSRLGRNLLMMGLEDAKFLDAIKILGAMHKIETLQREWRELHGMQEATA